MKKQKHDEITQQPNYFNNTMEKIIISIRQTKKTSDEITSADENFFSNMSETASAVNQANGNVEGVKQQVLTQASGVTEKVKKGSFEMLQGGKQVSTEMQKSDKLTLASRKA